MNKRAEDEKIRQQFEADPHLYLLYPKMYVVPNYE
jgi:hypothetical protein